MTAVKERPILFSGPMVRAILAGKKTQTRRVIKQQPESPATVFAPEGIRPAWCIWPSPHKNGDGAHDDHGCKFPYGSIGDRLWVRETWQTTDESINEQPGVVYRATDPDWSSMHGWTWRPSIFMPRRASRLTLEITGVRVERVQTISGRDCAAEGCEPDWEAFDDYTCGQEGWEQPEEFIEECEEEGDWINYGRQLVHSSEHREWERDRLNLALRLAYQSVWDSLNAKRGYGWEINPWVWVIEFRRVTL